MEEKVATLQTYMESIQVTLHELSECIHSHTPKKETKKKVTPSPAASEKDDSEEEESEEEEEEEDEDEKEESELPKGPTTTKPYDEKPSRVSLEYNTKQQEEDLRRLSIFEPPLLDDDGDNKMILPHVEDLWFDREESLEEDCNMERRATKTRKEDNETFLSRCQGQVPGKERWFSRVKGTHEFPNLQI
ncbi:histone acetyltransferase KAT6B-like [Papaver somniferum]|uniref:histone acetyltransferase KAT6B-like n=1 Tax=Papaver somniferum TaxID=3469 RepID=UPI000E6F5F91|nr:histone acetyltransferase KAT6B-like [Papaver somniferum]